MRRGCVFVIVALSAVAFFLSIGFYLLVWPETKKKGTSSIAYVIEEALEQYRDDQGSYPPGATTNAAIVRALYGENPRQKQYLESMRSIVRDGEFTDYWKRPMRIELPADGRARVISAGPNGSFGDNDDITSELIRAELAARTNERDGGG